MDRVGEVLGLQAEGAVLLVGHAPLAGERAVEEVPGVELDAGLGREDLQGPAALRIVDLRREGGLAASVGVTWDLTALVLVPRKCFKPEGHGLPAL